MTPATDGAAPRLVSIWLSRTQGGTAGQYGYSNLEASPDGGYGRSVSFDDGSKSARVELEVWRSGRFVISTYRGRFDGSPSFSVERERILKDFVRDAWALFRIHAMTTFVLMDGPPAAPLEVFLPDAWIEELIDLKTKSND